jgi:hypothetical protein
MVREGRVMEEAVLVANNLIGSDVCHVQSNTTDQKQVTRVISYTYLL